MRGLKPLTICRELKDQAGTYQQTNVTTLTDQQKAKLQVLQEQRCDRLHDRAGEWMSSPFPAAWFGPGTSLRHRQTELWFLQIGFPQATPLPGNRAPTHSFGTTWLAAPGRDSRE